MTHCESLNPSFPGKPPNHESPMYTPEFPFGSLQFIDHSTENVQVPQSCPRFRQKPGRFRNGPKRNKKKIGVNVSALIARGPFGFFFKTVSTIKVSSCFLLYQYLIFCVFRLPGEWNFHVARYSSGGTTRTIRAQNQEPNKWVQQADLAVYIKPANAPRLPASFADCEKPGSSPPKPHERRFYCQTLARNLRDCKTNRSDFFVFLNPLPPIPPR